MSECMIIDESNDQIGTCTEVTVRDIVGFILEDILCSALAISDKGCNQIGDFNITENFCQPIDQLPSEYTKSVKVPQNSPIASSQLNSGEKVNDSIGFLTAKESIDLVLENLVFKEEKVKSLHECKVISEDILADNELQIQNGQIRLESNRVDEKSSLLGNSFNKHFVSENEATTDTLQGEVSSSGARTDKNTEEIIQKNQTEEKCEINIDQNTKAAERPFAPFTTEKLRQSILQAWGNGKPSIIGGWEGDMSAQMEEIAHLIKELSSVQVLPGAAADPNRPRACAFAEEDVKRMIKEIEEINFNQVSPFNADDPETTYNTDGQGDADLESKSCHNKLPKTSKLGSKSEILNDDSKSLRREKQQKSKLSVNIQDKTYENLILSDKDEEEYLAEINMAGNSCITLTSRGSNEADGKEKEVKEFSNSSKRSDISFKTSYSDTSFSFGSKHPVESTLNEQTPEYEIKVEDMSESCPRQLASVTSNKDIEIESMNIKIIGSEPRIPEAVSCLTPEYYYDNQKNELLAFINNKSDFNYSFEPKIPDPPADEINSSQDNIKVDVESDVTLLERQSNTIRNTKSANNANEDSTCSLISHSEHVTSSEGKLVSNENLFFEENFPYSKKVKKEASSLQVSPLNNEVNIENLNILDKIIIESSKPSETNFEVVHKTRKKVNEIIKCQDETSVKNEDKDNAEDKKTNPQENSASSETKENASSTSSSSQTADSSSSKTLSDVQSPQQFKLHSNKMYFGADFDPMSQGVNESILTEADEAYIDRTENVLQIIDPLDSNTDDEESDKISFSLVNEVAQEQTIEPLDRHSNLPPNPQEENETSDKILETKKKHSGMTAIGPIKNIDYDPKDLTGPDIDFGKMTHITSSRQLAKDIFGSELKTVPSIRITRGNEPEDAAPILGESSHFEVTSLVNRDIASLTKVQKVREVMSYYPKPEEDFEDDDSLPRPRLDLKDVESTTDERFKVPDVSIPLLPFDVPNTNTNIANEYIQNIHLVLSASCFNDEELLEGGNRQVCKKRSINAPKPQNILDLKDSQLQFQNTSSKTEQKLIPVLINNKKMTNSKEIDAIQKDFAEDIQKDEANTQPKHCTLSRVLQKASNKFIRKDSEVILRNSKSLPRESTKMSTTESIKSFLNEHQPSATNVLKKSRSLLKNTQNIFKSRSQNRFGTQDSIPDKAEADDCSGVNIESKLSSFLRKEEFKRAKNLIKSTVEKTFKKFESENNEDGELKVKSEKDLRVAVRNEENYRIEKYENFRKFLPKSPMVYKSQFVKSQCGIQSEASCTDSQINGLDRNEYLVAASNGETSAKGLDETEASQEFEQAIEDLSMERVEEEKSWIEEVEHESDFNFQNDLRDIGYIVMETIQGLPTNDLESRLSEPKNPPRIEEDFKENNPREKDLPQENALESPNSLQTTVNKDDVHKTTPTSPQKNESKGSVKHQKEKKLALKNKKLSARFRSFWCSAFGRVKTPPENMEPYMKNQPNEENAN